MNDEVERIWKEVVVEYSKFYPVCPAIINVSAEPAASIFKAEDYFKHGFSRITQCHFLPHISYILSYLQVT
jgi:hypothetical protein